MEHKEVFFHEVKELGKGREEIKRQTGRKGGRKRKIKEEGKEK